MRVPGSLRRPRVAAIAAIAAVVVSVPVATGSTTAAQSLPAPTGLQAFLLRAADLQRKGVEAETVFPRTPSFAWNPVRGAARYRFELATKSSFADDSVLWASTALAAPAATVPLSLPWQPTGDGHPLYWRVRASGPSGDSAWSAPANFRLQAEAAPRTTSVGGRGYIRWTPVRGATGYDVWFVNLKKVVTTTTTLADLHDYLATGAPAKAVWRVRAERRASGPVKAGLPAVSYGPWSDAVTTKVGLDRTALLTTVSEGVGPAASDPSHSLMPVFLFPAKDANELHHVYVAADTACTDIVFNSAIVRGSAFAPRASQSTTGTQAPLPVNDGRVLTKGGKPIRPSEAAPVSAPGAPARITLPDSPPNGRYYWTVVSVERRANGSYHDLSTPQAACRMHKASFSKHGAEPALSGRSAPFRTGLSPIGNLFAPLATTARFYGHPVVAWKPAAGATGYELQWSRELDPWKTAGTITTGATSATLPLEPGTWYYRVRGLDDSISGAPQLGWSPAERVRITIPIFSVQRS